MNKYDVVIGLEIHAQLSTKTKMFCRCSTTYGVSPNTNICPVCTGQAGALPVINGKAVEYALKTALAFNCEINNTSVFSRKNYFYPDLPKGYQISQYDEPLAEKGFTEITLKDGTTKKIGITRIHMEEDAGKNIHDDKNSYVDLNRAGVPLVEIVSEPDMTSPEEAALYFKKLKTVIEYIETSDCNMEEGNLRCDGNISLKPAGEKKFGTKVEIKNLNSFRFLEKALAYEVERQTKALDAGEKIIQETRLFDSDKGVTRSMRKKEEANDYRYFPEPDLRPLLLESSFITKTKETLPELPDAKVKRFMDAYSLTFYEADLFCSDKVLASYYESTVKVAGDAKLSSSWIQTVVLKALNDNKISMKDFTISPQLLSELLLLIKDGSINQNTGKDVFDEMLKTGKPAKVIVEEKGLSQIHDEGLIDKIVEEVIKECTAQVEQYRSGKTAVMGFLVGMVMKKSGGKAKPAVVNELLKKKLG